MNEVTHDLNHRLLQLELHVSALKQQVAELELELIERAEYDRSGPDYVILDLDREVKS